MRTLGNRWSRFIECVLRFVGIWLRVMSCHINDCTNKMRSFNFGDTISIMLTIQANFKIFSESSFTKNVLT